MSKTFPTKEQQLFDPNTSALKHLYELSSEILTIQNLDENDIWSDVSIQFKTMDFLSSVANKILNFHGKFPEFNISFVVHNTENSKATLEVKSSNPQLNEHKCLPLNLFYAAIKSIKEDINKPANADEKSIELDIEIRNLKKKLESTEYTNKAQNKQIDELQHKLVQSEQRKQPVNVQSDKTIEHLDNRIHTLTQELKSTEETNQAQQEQIGELRHKLEESEKRKQPVDVQSNKDTSNKSPLHVISIYDPDIQTAVITIRALYALPTAMEDSVGIHYPMNANLYDLRSNKNDGSNGRFMTLEKDAAIGFFDIKAETQLIKDNKSCEGESLYRLKHWAKHNNIKFEENATHQELCDKLNENKHLK